MLIVGAGIGGLTTAIALRRAGIDAIVLEQAPELREVGAGISLWPNAIKALRRLGSETPWRPWELRSGRPDRDWRGGRALVVSRSAGGRFGAPLVMVRRAALHASC